MPTPVTSTTDAAAGLPTPAPAIGSSDPDRPRRCRLHPSRVDHPVRSVYRHRHRYRSSCHRSTRTKVACAVSWYVGDSDHYGTVTIYYGRHGGQLYWYDRLNIKRVSDRCYFAKPKRHCRVKTYH